MDLEAVKIDGRWVTTGDPEYARLCAEERVRSFNRASRQGQQYQAGWNRPQQDFYQDPFRSYTSSSYPGQNPYNGGLSQTLFGFNLF